MTAPPIVDSRLADGTARPHDRRRRPRSRPHAPVTSVRLTLGMINRLVRVADAAAIVGVVQLAQAVGVGIGDLSAAQALAAGAVCAAVFVTTLDALGGYRVERYRRAVSQALELAVGVAVATGAAQLALWIAAPEQGAVGGWTPVLVFVALGLARGASAAAIGALSRRGLLRRRVAVVGATAIADLVMDRLRAPQAQGAFECAGLFEDRAIDRPRTSRQPVAGDIAALRALAQRSRIDLIVLALPWRDAERLFALGERVQWISADIVTPLEDPGFLAQSSVVTTVAGLPTLQLTRHPFKGTQGLVKMAQDYAVALAALVVAGPVMLAAALAIRLTDHGPVLFRQDRVGFNGRPFSIYKFRSMTVDATDDGSGLLRRDNGRVTRVGALLRRTSIDELPQLLNVLRGEMSIVGPRPHVANMRIGDGAYSERVRTYAARHQIKPGITGWAQINGMRGGIDSLAKAERGADLDLHYMRNWSLALDVRIMLRTLTLHMAGPEVF